MSREEMQHLIRSAGYEPRQRTNLYERWVEEVETEEMVRRYAGAFTPAAAGRGAGGVAVVG
jgi:hypothetical protein